MKKFLVIFLLLTFFINSFALRGVPIGGKFKKNALNEKILVNEKKIIVFLNGKKKKNEKVVKTIGNVLTKKRVINVFFVKTVNVDCQQLEVLLKRYKNFKVVEDYERKLYGSMGVIVLPTILFVNENQKLIGEIAGVIPNMKIVFESYLNALISNSLPKNIYAEMRKKKSLKSKERAIRQAFFMFINGNYNVAIKVYSKLYETDKSDKRVVLGLFYSLLLDGKVGEAEKKFANMFKQKKARRFMLAYYYEQYLKTGDIDQLKKCADYVNFEPEFFTVIYKIGNEFEKNNLVDLAMRCYKESYKVLWKKYRSKR
ncbi:hypothetical protein TTHT_1310 [Thermotomaculum hydrothermale]|uniref:Thioredoxin-like fold domain-containing protein n=1 Tax=Thermotomaculum hydrothermale TaxID=981385 RepID=A0A7R6PMH8_9BACT|nr:hypothetical protein [Thermotomaculum hydrothermale]BBB32827.1 hypothetical protein TTHT_1310 [Thermotomaculum hydrothermale]